MITGKIVLLGDDHTFEASTRRKEKSGVLPGDSILGVGTTRLEHLVESSYAITLLELYDILTDFVDNAGNVVARVGVVEIFQPF